MIFEHVFLTMNIWPPGSKPGVFKTWELANRGENAASGDEDDKNYNEIASFKVTFRSPVAIIERIIELDFLEELQAQTN